MMSQDAVRELEPGLSLPIRDTVVTAERQAMYLENAEVDPALWGDIVDLSVLANDCILQTYPLRPKGMRGLHLGHRMVQRRPVRLGERLEMRGRVGTTGQMRKGKRVDYEIDFVDEGGTICVQAEMRSLQVDVEAVSSGGGGGYDGRTFYGGAAFEPVAEKHATAARVMGYSGEFPLDKVHFEPEVAAELGLRAPIAQGLMSLTWMMGELAAAGGPINAIDIDTEFRRPIYWDDRISILAKGQTEFELMNQLGELCSIGRVAHLARGL